MPGHMSFEPLNLGKLYGIDLLRFELFISVKQLNRNPCLYEIL